MVCPNVKRGSKDTSVEDVFYFPDWRRMIISIYTLPSYSPLPQRLPSVLEYHHSCRVTPHLVRQCLVMNYK